MTAFSANPFIYIFSVIAIVAVVLYFGFGMIDRMGLEVSSSVATVTDKKFIPRGESYYTNIAGGRAWVQKQEISEVYAVMMNVGEEPTIGAVSKEMFDSLNVGDRVRVKVRRTRFTRNLQVVEVSKE